MREADLEMKNMAWIYGMMTIAQAEDAEQAKSITRPQAPVQHANGRITQSRTLMEF